jgi:hypothetical protein
MTPSGPLERPGAGPTLATAHFCPIVTVIGPP